MVGVMDKKRMRMPGNQKGITMTLFLILMPVMVFFMGFAIDLAMLWHDVYRLELACRHAAYTGAVVLVEMRDGNRAYSQGTVRNEAAKTFRKNFPSATPTSQVNRTFIRVNGTSSVKQYFMPIVGGQSRVEIRNSYQVDLNG
jgi:Flp pilus assembly protein TadG